MTLSPSLVGAAFKGPDMIREIFVIFEIELILPVLSAGQAVTILLAVASQRMVAPNCSSTRMRPCPLTRQLRARDWKRS
jgi:hypothetical protein